MSKENKKIELVSPAGNFDQLKSAIHAGADAVYLSYKQFGARAYADNFDLRDLKKATSHASRNDVLCYLTFNTLVKDSELEDAYAFLSRYFSFCRDGIIIQDLGILQLIQENFDFIPIHASTQLNIHNTESVRLLKEMGFKRVVLAREMTLREIHDITDKKLTEIEIFGHGSQCYSYSGNCYFSSFVGGRSGNRGRCTQPCRMSYSIGSEGKKLFYLSKNDLCTIELLPKIIQAKINALKIEGRMKSAQYTAIVTHIYRKYIDRYYEDPHNYCIDPIDIYKLKQVFSRNLCHGYLEERFPKDIISLTKAGSVGNFLGKIKKIDYDPKKRLIKNIYVKSKWPIQKKDILEVWTKKGNERIEVQDIEKQDTKGKAIFQVKLDRKSAIALHDRVFKYYDKSLDDFSKSMYSYKINDEQDEPIQSIGAKKTIQHPCKAHKNDELGVSLISWIHDKNYLEKIIHGNCGDILYDGFADVLDFRNIGFWEENVRFLDRIQKKLIIKIPQILYDGELEKISGLIKKMLEIGIDEYYVSNLGVASNLSKWEDIHITLGSNLNIFNSKALDYLLKFLNKDNIVAVEPSSELDLDEIDEMISRYHCKNTQAVRFLIYGFGYYPLTVARIPKDELIKEKKSPSLYNFLVDEKGYHFIVGEDHAKNTVLYNAKKTCLLFDMENIIKKNIKGILIDSNFIKPDDFKQVLSNFQKAIGLLEKKDLNAFQKHLDALVSNDLFKDYTKAHIYKGTL